jgi:hypothetical protein
MPIANSETGEPNDIQAQIAQLREQVDALMKENEPQATGGATCTESTISSAQRGGARKDSHPVFVSNLSSRLLVSGGIGILLGRALRQRHGAQRPTFFCRKRWFRHRNRLVMRRPFDRRWRSGMRVRFRVGRPVRRLPLA